MARGAALFGCAVFAALLAVAAANIGASSVGTKTLLSGFKLNKMKWGNCYWDGTATVCDPWSWWTYPVPNKPSLLPQWTCDSDVTTNGTAVVGCTGVTAKGLLAAGTCSCEGTDQVTVSKPVFNSATVIDGECGAGTGRVCNSWICQCTLAADGLESASDATACAYCV